MKRILVFFFCACLFLGAYRLSAAELSGAELSSHFEKTEIPLNTLKVKGNCGSGFTNHPPVINVFHEVRNDVDSRVSGGVWAVDNYKRTIKVWDQTVPFPPFKLYCAKVEYDGLFTTLGGESPQGTDPSLAVGITGSMSGGFLTTVFTGTLNPTPGKPTSGNLGVTNYRCTSSDPGDHSSCTNLWNWQTTYFTSTTGLDYDYWGWSYDGDEHGTWNNLCTGKPGCPGNSGDITD